MTAVDQPADGRPGGTGGRTHGMPWRGAEVARAGEAAASRRSPIRVAGVRHQLVAVLGVAVCAVLAGARSYVAIAEWAHDLPVAVRRRLRIERVPRTVRTVKEC